MNHDFNAGFFPVNLTRFSSTRYNPCVVPELYGFETVSCKYKNTNMKTVCAVDSDWDLFFVFEFYFG